MFLVCAGCSFSYVAFSSACWFAACPGWSASPSLSGLQEHRRTGCSTRERLSGKPCTPHIHLWMRVKSSRRLHLYSLIICRAPPLSTTSSCPSLMAMQYLEVIITPWGQIKGTVMEAGTTCLQWAGQQGKICPPFVYNVCAFISIRI